MSWQPCTYAAMLKGRTSRQEPCTSARNDRCGQISLLDLPTELTSMICKRLGRRDLSSLRLANRYLAGVGAQEFPTVFCLDLTPRSIDRLKELCHDPQLALVRRSVKEVEIITGLVSSPLPSLEAFRRDFYRVFQDHPHITNLIKLWIKQLVITSANQSVPKDFEQQHQVTREVGKDFCEQLFVAMNRYSESATLDVWKIQRYLSSFENLVSVAEVVYHQRPLSDCMNVPKPIRSWYESSPVTWEDITREDDGLTPVYSSPVLEIKAYFLWRHFYSQRRNIATLTNHQFYSPARWLTEPAVQKLPFKYLELSAPIDAFTTNLKPAFRRSQSLRLELLHARSLGTLHVDLEDLSRFWVHELASSVSMKSLYLWLPGTGNLLLHKLLSEVKLPLLRSFTVHCERCRHDRAHGTKDWKAAYGMNFMRSLIGFVQRHSETIREVDITLRLPETVASQHRFDKTGFPQVFCFPTAAEIVALRQEISSRYSYSRLTRLRLSVQVASVGSVDCSGLSSFQSEALGVSVDNESKLEELATSLALVDEIGRHSCLFSKHEYGSIAAIYDFGMAFP